MLQLKTHFQKQLITVKPGKMTLMSFEFEPGTFWIQHLAAVSGITLYVPPHCFNPQAVIVASSS